MRSRVYGYFILPDGSISTTQPLTGSCMTVCAPTKQQAELEMPYVDFDQDVLAEVQVWGKSHRILFVRAGALSRHGLHQHLYLRTGTHWSLELIASEPNSLARRISMVLDGLESHQAALLALKPHRRFTPERVVREILDLTLPWGEVPQVELHPFVCSSIPKHTSKSPNQYPGATPIPVPRRAA